MHKAAMDYFKKQLIISWQKDCQYNESLAYFGMAQQYYYINANPQSRKHCRQCLERYA